MHWLTEFRKNYRNKDGSVGISREEFAKLVHKRGTFSNPGSEIGCSEVLIAILENGGITHPKIADRIADVCKATPQQRDTLVHKMHWGTYVPKPIKEERSRKTKPRLDKHGIVPENARPVVRIDEFFKTIRYASMSEAARAENCNINTVILRCKKLLSPATNEFETRDHTWRFADEWDAMDSEAKYREMHAAGMFGNWRKEKGK